MSDYLVPGSIRLDSRLIEEKAKEKEKQSEKEEEEERRKKVDIPDMSGHR